ncbi:MAG: DapH/DapD/GlmU-related protein [Clostridia bacterium]
MEKPTVYLVEKSTLYDNVDICGIPFGKLARHMLGKEAHLVSSPEEVEQTVGRVVALIYSDTPLVTLRHLDKLSENILEGLASGYRIGAGYIKKAGAQDGELSSKLPFTVTKVESLESLKDIMMQRKYEIIERHLKGGVIFHDPFSVHIDDSVIIGRGTEIYPMVHIKGKTVIGERVIIYSYCDLEDTVIGDESDLRAVYAIASKIGKKCTLGPFACLRKGAIIGNNCRVGDFVEVKNSTLEDDVKAAHLAYIGDSYVGENTNVGCGAIFANFDGKVKRSVIVGKDVFIGCNTNLVAPLQIEDGAYIAAGSTVTQDVPGNALCIARAKQIVKNKWDRPLK